MKKIVLLGLLSFLIAAIWQLPLSFAKPYAEKLIQGLKLEGVSGSVWNGSAQKLITNNQDFGQVDWKVNPLQSLTSLSLKSSFSIKGNQLTAEGTAAVTPNKKIIIDKTTFDIDAAFLNHFQKQAKLAGDLQGNIDRAELETNTLPILDAVVDWKQGTVSSILLNLTAGDYHFIITPDSEGLTIQPSSKEAPIDLKGRVKLSKDWVLKPDIMINSTNQGVAGMLKLAGKPQSDGSTHITNSTDLKPFLKLK